MNKQDVLNSDAAKLLPKDFQDWLAFELDHEDMTDRAGNILTEHDPDDPGGATFAGIDKSSHPNFPFSNPQPANVVAAYAADWTNCHADMFPKPVNVTLANFAVNMGRVGAMKVLQGAVGVDQDGVLDPRTLTAVKGAISTNGPLFLALKMCDAADARYKTFSGAWKYLRGWLNRDNDLRDFAKKEGE